MGYKRFTTHTVSVLSQSVATTDADISGSLNALSSSFSSSQASLSSSFTASLNLLSSSFTASLSTLSSSFSSSYNNLNTQVVTPTVTTVTLANMDLSNNNRFFIKTATGSLGWTFSNVPATGSIVVCLELTNGGTGTQTWASGTKWPGGTAPTLTTSGVDVLAFITDDGGTAWRGVALMLDSK